MELERNMGGERGGLNVIDSESTFVFIYMPHADPHRSPGPCIQVSNGLPAYCARIGKPSTRV